MSVTLERAGARPLTVNRVMGMHRQAWATHTRQTRNAWWVIGIEHRVGPYVAVTIDATPLHKDRRSPQDVAACACEVKAAIDGLVDAEMIPDDTPQYLRSITFYPPQIVGYDGLRLTITEVAA